MEHPRRPSDTSAVDTPAAAGAACVVFRVLGEG